MSFDFYADFQRFENNPAIQNKIEKIICWNNPLAQFEWITDKKLQKRGVDVKILKNGRCFNIDIKGVSYANNHHYLEDISIEIVSNVDEYLSSKGKRGLSWLFKTDSLTEELLYYWLDAGGSVKSTIVIIPFKSLWKWGHVYFNQFEFYRFLKRAEKKIRDQKYRTEYIGKFKDFEVFSAKNRYYYTINCKTVLTYLNGIFHEFELDEIYSLKKPDTIKIKSKKMQKMGDLF